jgi:GTP cyclohydrolase I
MDEVILDNRTGTARGVPDDVWDDALGIRNPTREQAQACVRSLLAFIGENPDREGLRETPDRVLRAWEEFFGGYNADAESVLQTTFEEVDGYEDIVLLRNVDFVSHCEHHMIAIHGKAHIAYQPRKRVVGLSKLARVIDIYARRLQTQEALTAQVANTVEKVLAPVGLAVMIEASHQCMVTRGVQKNGAETVTTTFRGSFKDNPKLERRFLRLVGATGPESKS